MVNTQTTVYSALEEANPMSRIIEKSFLAVAQVDLSALAQPSLPAEIIF